MDLHLSDSNSRIILPLSPSSFSSPFPFSATSNSDQWGRRRKKTREKRFYEAESAQRPSPWFFPQDLQVQTRLHEPFRRVPPFSFAKATNDRSRKSFSRWTNNRHREFSWIAVWPRGFVPRGGGWKIHETKNRHHCGIIFFVSFRSSFRSVNELHRRIGD